MGTLIVGLVVAAVLAAAAVKLIKDKRNGKSGCGCGCKNCAMAGKCHNVRK